MSVKVLDGGLSTQLEKYVGEVDGHPLWTSRFLIEAPKNVYKMHMDFLNAGSNIICTLTYQASVQGYKNHLNLDHQQSIEIMKSAVKIAQNARTDYLVKNPKSATPLVAGAVGPYGAILHDGSEYSGGYDEKITKEFLKDFHRPRVAALVDAGVDILALETVPCSLEAEAHLELLQEFPQAKAWLSFSCKDDAHLSHGELFSDVAIKTWDAGNEQIMAVGCNCVNPRYVTNLLTSVNRSRPDIDFVVYPNSGEVYLSDQGWTGECKSFASSVPEWVKLGVKFIGGCCRTSAEDVKKLREVVNGLDC